MASKKKFPDLTGDGKVTKKDILKGRGVEGFKEGGKVSKTAAMEDAYETKKEKIRNEQNPKRKNKHNKQTERTKNGTKQKRTKNTDEKKGMN